MARKQQVKLVDNAKQEIINDAKNYKTKRPHIYFSFMARIAFNIILFLIFLLLGIYFLTKSFYLKNKEVITYREKSQVDYSVCLLENQFYEENCLKKDMKYVASLIDKINLKFDYNFDIDENEDMDFTYDIVGKLVISDKLGEKSYFEKTYDLISSKKSNMRNSKSNYINENLSIDYAYYNSLANRFKSAYGVDVESKLVVYMTINKSDSSESKLILNNESVMYVSIPLSEKAIDIELNYKDINTTSSLVSGSNVVVANVVCIILSVISVVLSIIMMIKTIRKFPNYHAKNVYDKHVNKILKEYDRLIGEASTMISFEDKEIIKFKKFTELLDIHDNLGLPIMHYTVTKHVKSYFYIVHENVVYLHVVKAVDLEM